MDPPPRLWPVFVAYLSAFVAIVVASIAAAVALRASYPDLPEREVLSGLPALLAGGAASSVALVVTVLVVTRPLEAARLRLLPGREGGRHLLVMIVGVLALGQALDSVTTLSGLADRGAMPAIRQALAGAKGIELFVAVAVIGLMAGTAEELFFRGYMQTRLRERWRPAVAVLATSACFGILHLEWIHASLAFVLGLYLGFVTEASGSTLPAVACHVVNNAVFTVLTVTVGTVEGLWQNTLLLGGSVAVFAACVAWLRRALPRPLPP
ncbi:MAG: CPBP family intramembrane metalloprotease [Candidatus Rokubacteria bacterium]|nr:CPBP family intramembrane metalloprotease [Candidatus Rokubacteria bacterium]